MAQKSTGQGSVSIFEPAADKVLAIDLDRIKPNPFQPRREIPSSKIDELAQSIKASGLIQPIVVRRKGDFYELIVGERRFLACRKLGWKKISAVVKILPDNEMAIMALIENIQRENLNYIEEANGYLSLMKIFGFTQEVLAQRLGKSQSTIANKIRLLKLSSAVRDKLIEQGLTERHARVLLKLETEQEQLNVICEIVEKNLTVSQTEKRIERITGARDGKKRSERLKRSKPIIRDLRIVLNTIREAVDTIKNSGLNPEVEETIEDDYIEVTIRLTGDMLKQKRK